MGEKSRDPETFEIPKTSLGPQGTLDKINFASPGLTKAKFKIMQIWYHNLSYYF